MPGPDPLVDVLERGVAVGVPDDDGVGERLVDADPDLAADDVRAEHGVRVAVLAADDLVELLAGMDDAHARAPIVATAANGMATHAGRLRVS